MCSWRARVRHFAFVIGFRLSKKRLWKGFLARQKGEAKQRWPWQRKCGFCSAFCWSNAIWVMLYFLLHAHPFLVFSFLFLIHGLDLLGGVCTIFVALATHFLYIFSLFLFLYSNFLLRTWHLQVNILFVYLPFFLYPYHTFFSVFFFFLKKH